MLRELSNCAVVRRGAWPWRRYALVIGTRETARLGRRTYALAARTHAHEPVPLIEEDRRRWWWYRNRFYWEDGGYSADDVVALVADRERRRQRRLDRANAALRQEQTAAGRRRESLARDVRLAVWRRDRGRCRECGDGFDLQYDHVIPIALGGASSVENLQLLCGDCNRAKGASL